MKEIEIGGAAVYALLGYAVVFFGLVLLMTVVMLLGRAMVAAKRRPEEKTVSSAPAVPAKETPKALPAKGTGGEILLHDVPAREAAMVMAVVAYRLQKPLNELRFKSIREVKDK
ncbi:MAG: OadG family protein [Clostridia bacterium]|nr:OadG family protein [Clostridia bacterium]